MVELTVDAAVTILIGLTDHLIHFIIGELLSNGSHDVTKLSSRDETVVVTVEDLYFQYQ